MERNDASSFRRKSANAFVPVFLLGGPGRFEQHYNGQFHGSW